MNWGFIRARAARLPALTLAITAGLAAQAEPAATACPPGACVSMEQLVSAREAWRMKRELGDRMLLVDIRGRAETFFTGMPVGIDAQVPFAEPAPGFPWNPQTQEPEMELQADFRPSMDALLRARHLRHDQPVILLCRTGEVAHVAALNLQEHGYSRVLVVLDGFEGHLARGSHRSDDRIHDGWKGSGLPWTSRVSARWLDPSFR